MVDLDFGVISNTGRELLIRANVPWNLFMEAFMTATDRDGLAIVSVNGKS